MFEQCVFKALKRIQVILSEIERHFVCVCVCIRIKVYVEGFFVVVVVGFEKCWEHFCLRSTSLSLLNNNKKYSCSYSENRK